MPAQPARRILGYDKPTHMVTLESHHGGRTQLPLSALPKVEQIAVAKFLGIRFVGKNPLAMDVSAINHAIVNDLKEVVYEPKPSPTPSPKPIPTPTPSESQPSPKEETPMPQPKPTNPMGLEEMVRHIASDVVTTALDGYQGGVNADDVKDIVNPIMSGFRHEVTELVRSVKPIVNTIVVKDRPAKEMKGVQHFVFPKVLGAVSQGVNLWLVGPAGTGKSTIGEQVAEALSLPFSAVNCTSTMTETALKGYNDANGNYVPTEFRRIFEGGGVFVFDEVDNANPNVLGALNSALANGFMAFADRRVQKHADFVAIATGNTYGSGATMEYVGRNPIDGATIDRFAQLVVPIDTKVEDAMLGSVGLDEPTATKWIDAVRKARHNAERFGLKVIVSPRATMNGARLIRSGAFTMTEAFDATVIKGAKPDQAEKIREGVNL
jgi:cobaltochelatase CobS